MERNSPDTPEQPEHGVTDTPLPDRARNGRGAVSNAPVGSSGCTGTAMDDGWRTLQDDEPQPRLDTTVTFDQSRTVISRNDSPDIGFDRSINPYRGCEHGCIYCFARPTHAWLGLSPGLDFETRLFAKPDAANLLERELARPGYKPRPSPWAPTPTPTSRSDGA